MKDYATETDIIKTPDPVFFPGDRVEWGKHRNNNYHLLVESFSWNSIENSWTYTLVYFLTEGDGSDVRWNGSLALEEAFEKDLKLISRHPRKYLY